MASTTFARRNGSPLATLARWGLPWLLSFSMHLALFLTLALSYRATSRWLGYSRADGNSGHRTFFDTSIGTDDGGGALSIGMTLGPVTGSDYYADDEPVAGDAAAGKPAGAAGVSGGGRVQLASVLSEGPGVDLSGVLPKSGTVLGAAGLEGGGVGTARGAGNSARPSTGLKGGYARTGVFGVQGEGRKFVYVFDRSGSMDGHGGAPLAAAKSQLIVSLEDLGSTHQFQIIFYNEHPRVFNISGAPGRLVFATDSNRNLARRFVQSMTADGATEHEEALVLALRMAPDVIFFLTDADEPRMNADQLSRIERLNRGSSINTIEFGYGPPLDTNNFLVQLAERNGGKHVYVDVAGLPAVR